MLDQCYRRGTLCRPQMVDLSAPLGDDEVEEEFGLAELARWVEEDWQADLEARLTGIYRAEVRNERLMRSLMEAAPFGVGHPLDDIA